MGKVKQEPAEQDDKGDVSIKTEPHGYEDKVGHCSVIAKPMAPKKLSKKIYKLIKKSSSHKNFIRNGLKIVQKQLRLGEKGLQIVSIEDLPIGEPLETPLINKKKRTLSPPPEPNWTEEDHALHSPVPLPAMYVESGGSTSSTSSTSYQREVTVESGSPSKGPSERGRIRKSKRVRRSLCPEAATIVSSSMSVTQSVKNRPLQDAEIEDFLNYGSDGSDSGEEEMEVPLLIPNAVRILWETPEDDEDGNGDRILNISTAPIVTAGDHLPARALTSSPDSATASISSPVSAAGGGDNPHATPDSVPESVASSPYFPRDFLDFDWKSFPSPPIPPAVRREPFCSTDCGPTIAASDPYELFTAIWDRQLVKHIVRETNLYAEQVAALKMRTGELYPQSRIANWKDTSIDEIYVYLSIVLAMGIVIKARMLDYWSHNQDIFFTPGFRAHMSLRRFQMLSSCLHFNDNRQMQRLSLSPAEAKLYKIEPVVTHLNMKFSTLYKLNQNIALDESLLQWKGWLDINQFIPNKAAAVGIKSYEICESQTGYLWRFIIHAHKPTPQTSTPTDPFTASTPALVLSLIKGLEYSGHTLWMDNFYNSPALARKLKSIGFDCVGTLRTNRKQVPNELTQLTKANMRPGRIAGFTSGDVDVLVWRDQNRVALISTYHGNAVSTSNDVTKPILVRDYNICMGGVDKKDQMLATYPIERKRTRVWYKKLFRRLLNVSVLNAYTIHKKNLTPPLTHRTFRTTLVKSILERHSAPIPIVTPLSQSNVFEAKHHYPQEYPFLPAPSRNRHRHPCNVCKTRTVTFCVGCDKAVCAFKCFSVLHS